MLEIFIIGPEPLCIRCLTTLKRAREVAQQYPEVTVNKLSTDAAEAQKYGRVAGGHVIAKAEKVEHNHHRIEELRGQIEGPENEVRDGALVETAMSEIEKELTPVKEKARERGYLMTPVVIVNGKVKSAGEIPKKEEIEAWVQEALNHKQ